MMKPLRFSFALLMCLPVWVLAQSSEAPKARSPQAVKATHRQVAHHKPAPRPAPLALPALSESQRELAQQVEVGRFPCEFGVFVSLQQDARAPGYFLAQHGKNSYWLAPVASATGAVRLEDRKAGVVWLQLNSKSMLMSEKLGRRLVDACMSPGQVLVTLALQKNPPPFILDGLPTQAAQTAQTPPALALGERLDDK